MERMKTDFRTESVFFYCFLTSPAIKCNDNEYRSEL